MIKLYYHPFSTFARRVTIALIEKDIPHERIEIDMAKREHKAPDYLALNPYGRVPTLVEDDLTLYESTAILNYLEATHPAPPLVPQDVKDRARVDMHMKLSDLQMTRQTGTIIFPKRFLPEERWDKAAMEQAKSEIESHLAIMNQELEGKDYLVANQFTLADLCYIPFVEFLPLMEIAPPPGVAAWSARILERPSAVETKPAA